MKRLFPACMLICLLCSASFLQAQSNITVTNSLADQVLRGNYSPALFAATNVVDQPDSLTRGVQDRISPDSLLSYLEALTGFGNRNTGSDTVSSTWGIGAARRWAHAKFADISARNENRLLVGYLQFDRNICSMTQHRNVMAVLPGSDSTTDGFILMEAHMDSRCDVPCGGGCNAQGADDNGSGSALVLELARVL
ncbi:MAG: M28 family peptidase, partial [Bacteroidota bacterium]